MPNIIFLNANSDRRLDDPVIKKAYPELHPEVRQEKILKVIQDTLNDNNDDVIFHLFELSTDMLYFFTKYAADNSFYTYTAKYNYSRLAFHHLVLYKNQNIIKSIDKIPLTKSEFYFPDEDRPVAPKVGEQATEAFLAYKDEVLDDTFEKAVVLIEAQFDDVIVHIYCVHLGLSNEARVRQSEKLVEIIRAETINANRPFIIGGDFNCFDATKKIGLYDKQIEIFKRIANWETENFDSTFNAYPHDLQFKMEPEEIIEYRRLLSDIGNVELFRHFCDMIVEKYGTKGGALDQIFTRDITVKVELIDVGNITDHMMVKLII